MPYAGYCQACVNEKGEGLACGQDPLGYCDKHVIAHRDFILQQEDYVKVAYKVTDEQYKAELARAEEEIKSRGL